MRRTLLCVIGLALCVAPAWSQTGAQESKAPAAKTDHSADDQAITKLGQDAETALNNHDAKTYAAMFAMDADTRAADGGLVKGRAAIEKYLAGLFAGPLKNLKVTISSSRDTRYLGANLAITNSSAQVTGATGPDGKDLSPYTSLVTQVLVKRNGSWQVLSSRVWPANAIPGPAPSKKATF